MARRRTSLSLTAPVDEPGETTTRGWLYRASQRKGSGLSGLGGLQKQFALLSDKVLKPLRSRNLGIKLEANCGSQRD